MLVKQEQINPCEVELHIEVPADQVASAVDSTYAEIGKYTNIPGFRKGKAPRAILEQFLDEDKVKERVAEKIMSPAYKEALDESKLDPYAPADVELVGFELTGTMEFKAIVPLAPKIELGNYVGLEVERRVVDIKDEDVEEEIKSILDRHAQYQLVEDRPGKEGDNVLVELTREDIPDQEPMRNVVQIGMALPEFNEALAGMKPEEEKDIEVTYPENYGAEDLKGKTVKFKTKVIEIREKKLPEFTDEWVKSTFAGEPIDEEESEEDNYERIDTVEKLKNRIRDFITKDQEQASQTQMRSSIVAQIVDSSTVNYPTVMVEEDIDERIADLVEELKQRKLTIDDYLKYEDKTYEELRESLREDVEITLRNGLVLREIVEKEKIEVTDEDVNEEIDSMAQSRNVPAVTVRAYIDKTNGLPGMKNRILTKKVMDFLVNASNIKNVGQ